MFKIKKDLCKGMISRTVSSDESRILEKCNRINNMVVLSRMRDEEDWGSEGKSKSGRECIRTAKRDI